MKYLIYNKLQRLLVVVLLLFGAVEGYAQQKHNVRTPVDPATVAAGDQHNRNILSGKFESSKIYPNTERNFKIYVPEEYDGSKPACLLLGLDGTIFNDITVMTNLMKTGEMPLTIGVFLEPGVVYREDPNAQSGKAVVRYNRSNEFDRTNAEFVTFLETEFLPFVETLSTNDGRKIRLSHDANDRAITGASSSGIAAFTVAWERPDLFSRVYSSVGTFVAMRGGNEYPALVRKTEPKPLRIFLQDGVNDTWDYIFGDWWEQNQLMASALNFAGYEFDYKWDRGNHGIYYGRRAYPDAMRWLWRGWPARVEAGESMNGMLQSLLIKDSVWRECADEEVRALFAAGADNVTFDSRSVYVNGKRVAPVKDAVSSLKLADGRVYVSDIDGNIWMVELAEAGGKGEGNANGDKITANGDNPVGKSAKKSRPVVKRMNTVETGGCQMAVYPDYRMLITTEKNSNWLISYIINPNGTLEAGERFYWLHNTENHTHVPYGNMLFDTLGNLYIATPQGIQICDQNGRVRAILPVPSRKADAIAFSGNYLYVFSGGKYYVRKVQHTGYNHCEGAIEVKSQGQG